MILTQSDIVTEGPQPVRAPSSLHRWWAIPLAALGFLAIGLVLLGAIVPSKFFVDKPGCVEKAPGDDCSAEYALVPADAQPVAPRLEVDGTTVYPSDGDVYFVTIREPKITMLDWFATHRSPATRLLTHQNKFGNQTEEELLQSGQRQMTGAKDRATYVALKAAGFPVSRKNGAAIVDYVICLKANESNTKCIEEPPASKVLKPNDVITELDGTKINTLDDLQPVLAKVKAGDTIPITVERDGEPVETKVQTILAPGEDQPRTILGFSPVDTTTVALPDGISVDFDTAGIGGPSAGLAFTLALIDQVTEGNLMGDGRVAVTGEIDIDGNVGAIGGLNSKASAVQQVGVKYFLVPAGQPDAGKDPNKPNPDSIAAARKVVGDNVEIIPVATLDEALAVLQRLGGDPLPKKAS